MTGKREGVTKERGILGIGDYGFSGFADANPRMTV